ncbi:MAG TPA: ATPase, partial [Thermosipho africanus]|nr:ATPase [Thermosipho africanus]
IITKNKTTFIVSYIFGTLGAILYIISLYYDIISLNLKRKVSKKGYYIRYIFSASIFLLVGVIFEEKLTAIISAFLGLINVKISAYLVGFLFGGGWHEKKD